MTKRKKLPKGWRWATLTDPVIAEIDPKTPLPREWSVDRLVSFLPMALVDETSGTVRAFEEVPLASCKKGKRRFQQGDVLFAKITPCVQNGKLAYIEDLNDPVGFGSTEFYVLRAGVDLSAEYLWFYLRTSRVIEAAVSSFTGTSGRQRVPSTFWDSLRIPLPRTLAEQERIVEVLRQADAIRRKRAEARRLADQILPALFLDMFGDPTTNPRNWPVEPFEHVLKDETRKAGKLPIAEYQSQGEFPIIDQGEKFISGYTDRADCVFDGALPVILFGDHTRRLKYVGFPFVLGADGVKILRPLKGVPSFIYQQLRASPIPSRGYERHFKYLKELSLVLPPKHLQEWLADCFTQYYESENHATDALLEAERVLDGILSRAFSGELPAE